MRIIREFGLVAGGGLALLSAFLLVLLVPTPSYGFGWTAYAPVADLSFAPAVPFFGIAIGSLVLAFAGVALITADIAYRAGRSRRSGATAAESPQA